MHGKALHTLHMYNDSILIIIYPYKLIYHQFITSYDYLSTSDLSLKISPNSQRIVTHNSHHMTPALFQYRRLQELQCKTCSNAFCFGETCHIVSHHVTGLACFRCFDCFRCFHCFHCGVCGVYSPAKRGLELWGSLGENSKSS